MQCIIPHPNLKTLVRGLHSLSRIGDELYVEPTKEGINFRTVNAAQSAYSSLFFNLSFFNKYKSEFDTNESGTCKISMKACLKVFKTPNCMDRHVEFCKIEIGNDCDKLTFQIHFIQGYTKTHYLSVNDIETVQLRYNKNEMGNQLSILARMLHSAIRHFRPNDEEITLHLTNDKVHLKNYFENGDENQKVVRTNFCLQRSEFETYNVTKPGSITFALRELRAVCAFSESSNSLVCIYFEMSGKPVIFTVENSLYEADYVVSTLPPEMLSGDRPHRRSQLSDVISSLMPSSSIVSSTKKRKLANINEEQLEPEIEPEPGPPFLEDLQTNNQTDTADCTRNLQVVEAEVHPEPNTPVKEQLKNSQNSKSSDISRRSRFSFGQENESDGNFDELLMKIDMNSAHFQVISQKNDDETELSGLNELQIEKIEKVFSYCFNYSPPTVSCDQVLVKCDD